MKIEFKIDITQFIRNVIAAAPAGSKEVIVHKNDIFNLFYGEEEQFHEFIQNDLCDEDLYDLFDSFFWSGAITTTKDAVMADFGVNVDWFNEDSSVRVVGPYELCIDSSELDDWVSEHPLLQGCYLFKYGDYSWLPLLINTEFEKSDSGVSIQEDSEKIVSEANNQESAKNLTWEEAIKYCVNEDIFKHAYHNFDIYWAGESNPMYGCANILEFGRAIMGEINNRINIYRYGAQDRIDFNIPHDVDAQAWLDLIVRETNNLYSLYKNAREEVFVDVFGVRLAFWAIRHKFIKPMFVVGFHGYGEDGLIHETDEYRINSVMTWYFMNQDKAIITACNKGNNSNKCSDIYPWWNEVDLCHYIMGRGTEASEEGVQKISKALAGNGLRKSKCILPVFAWSYEN